MNNTTADYYVEKRNQQGFILDPKRILNHALRFWYIIVISLLVCCSIAYVKNRYAIPLFPVSGSIIIKESKETTETNLILNSTLSQDYRNYLNELYIIRSLPLLERTIDGLNFNLTFYREGSVLTTEIYDLPIKTSILNSISEESQIYFKLIDDKTFQLSIYKDSDNSMVLPRSFSFEDSIFFHKQSMRFSLQDGDWGGLKDQVFLLVIKPSSSIAREYLGKLKVDWAEEGAGVIDLTVVGTIPSKEIHFLNGLIRQYQLFDLEKKNTVASRTIDFINNQLKGLSDSLGTVEGKLQRFKDQRSVTDIGDKAARYFTKMEAVEVQKGELLIRKNYYKYLLEYLGKDSQAIDQIIMPTSVGISDPVLTPLLTRMVEVQMQLRMNRRVESPVTGELSKQLKQMRQDILEAVHNLQATEEIRITYLDNQLKAIDKVLATLPADERQLVSIKRNYSLLENLYVYLLQKRAEAGITRASNTSDISLVNPPSVSGAAITSNPTTNYVYAAVFGLLIPFIFFVLMELVNTKIQSREDLEKITSIPFIAGVGHKKSASNLEILERPRTSIAESFRALRANLGFFIHRSEKAVVVVTSSLSGEGKTFTSINLASVLALSDKTVLIVGADMRRPKIFSDFGLNNNIGLSSFLSGMSSFDEVIQKTSHKGLDLVSGGPVPPNPSELLLTSKMAEFISAAREKYAFVIIDTPPIAVVSDALALAEYADHILFLVRQNYTPKDILKVVQDYYNKGKFSKMSIVLNDIYKHGLGYGYGYGYRYPYSYGYGRSNEAYYED